MIIQKRCKKLGNIIGTETHLGRPTVLPKKANECLSLASAKNSGQSKCVSVPIIWHCFLDCFCGILGLLSQLQMSTAGGGWLRSHKSVGKGGSVYLCIPWKKYTLILAAPTSTVLAFLVAFPSFLLYFSSVYVKKEPKQAKKGPKSGQCILVYTCVYFGPPNPSASWSQPWLCIMPYGFTSTDYFWLSDLEKGPKYTQVYTDHLWGLFLPYSSLF